MGSLTSRIKFACREARANKDALKLYKAHQSPSFLDLDPSQLKESGIKLVVLDFDGVLASHNEVRVDPSVRGHLNEFAQVFSEPNIVIYSNKPMPRRIEEFNKAWPYIEFYIGPKKPYPEGLKELCKQKGFSGNEVVMVDDRLLTGVLAAHLAGVRAIWITKPIVSYEKRPFKESFFSFLRFVETLWLG